MFQIHQSQMIALQQAREEEFERSVESYCLEELPGCPPELAGSAVQCARFHGIETLSGAAQVANVMYFWGLDCATSTEAPRWIRAILNDTKMTPDEKLSCLTIQLGLEDDD